MEQPKIPTLKDAQKPQVKIKGLGAGLTLFDRLKQFKKKDLAFILAGLGTLFMAPLAEHFMMAPENGDSSMKQGWGGPGSGSNLFGSGSSPYENGNNSIAQGGAIGGSGDIITPLNVRDPSALVMGPGGTQQPNAGSIAPPTAPPTASASSSEDYKDALKASASRAGREAVKKAPLPIPKIAVGGSGLRGLGVAGGGSSASGGMAPLNSGNLGQVNGGGGGLNLVRTSPGFRSAAGPRGNAPQGLDGTKRAGQNAGDAFSRTGSALSGLNAAASEQIPTGGQGFNGGGQGGVGANDKAPGGSGPGGSKSVGESLAFIEAKERMMENLKLEFEKRKLKDPELLLYGIRNEVLKAGALKIGEGLTKTGMCKFMNMGCPGSDAELSCRYYNGPASGLTPMCDKDSKGPCWTKLNNGSYQLANPAGGAVLDECVPNGKEKGKTDPKAEGAISELSAGVGDVCNKIGKNSIAGKGDYDTYLQGTVLPAAKNTEIARNTLVAGGNTQCQTTPVTGDTASKMLIDAKALLFAAPGVADAQGKVPDAKDALGLIKAGAVKATDEEAKAAAKTLVDAAALIKKAEDRILEAEKTLGKPLAAPTKIGVDEDAFKRVTSETGRVITAQGQATDIITSLRRSAANLTTAITSIEPLVDKTVAKPLGALPDQIVLNKTSADLVTEAAAAAAVTAAPAPTVASKVTLPTTIKGEIVKDQTPALTALKELQAAITAVSTATTETLTDAKKEVTTKQEAAKVALEKSQTSLVNEAATRETSIRTIDIRMAP